MKTFFKNMNLRTKCFLCFFGVAMACILSLGIYIYGNTRDILMEENFRSMENSLAQAGTNIDMILQGYENASSLIFMNEQVQDLISVDFTNYGYEDLYYYIRNYMGAMLAVNSDVKKFSIFTTNMTVAADLFYIYKATPEVQKEEWYQKAVNASGLPVYYYSGYDKNGINVLYLVRLLDYYSYGDLRNVLRMEINGERLRQTIAEVEPDEIRLILDESDRVMICTEPVLNGEKIEQILEKMPEDLENCKRTTAVYQGQEMLMSSVTDSRGWKIISLMPESGIRSKVQSSLWRIAGFVLLAAVMALVFTAFFSGLITRRITNLTEAVEKMRDGAFGIQITDGGKDEIGILSDAFSEMSLKVKQLIRDVYEKELTRKTAELNLLQEQINPHFLYNVLSSVNSMALREGNMEISEMMQHLSDFYRISLNKGKNILTVQEELNLVENYLKIQRVRFDDVIQVEYEIEDELRDCKIIKMILQPVVENAIHHALRSESETLHIKIRLEKTGKDMQFVISDDGIGMNEETLHNLNSEIKDAVQGYGLKNVSIRLQLQYGEEYGVKVYSEIEKGTEIVMKLPIVRGLEC